MSPEPPTEELPGSPPNMVGDAVVMATEALFLDIASKGDASLKDAVILINVRRRLLRAHEAALISDREAELAALRSAWEARDIPSLKTLIVEYYRRRQALAPQLAALLNAPPSRQ